MKRILVGLDGASRAPSVLAAAVAIGRAQGSRVVLLRCLPRCRRDFWKTTGAPLLDLLERRASSIWTSRPQRRRSSCSGGWQAVCDMARTLEADLVVIGSHGDARFDRLPGTTAAKVVNHAHCSVLVVREPHPQPAGV